MKVLLIDGDPFFRTMTRKYLQRDLPECKLYELDPVALAGDDVSNVKGYDIVLVSHDLGPPGVALDWLTQTQIARTQRIVYVTETRSIDLAAGATRLGCKAVICRSDIKGTRLATLLRGIVDGTKSQARAEREMLAPKIHGYKLAARIGEGAMSRVYLAERESDRVTVVLKVIDLDYANNHANVRRCVAEAEMIAELNSPHVVQIFEQGFTDDVGFIAMEFFPRGDLKQRIEYGISPGDALNCLANICYGLSAIHSLGIVHRDLKPANVMFRHDDTLALADFGISRRFESESEAQKAGRVLGTPHYMSPEQGRGGAPDPRNDLYSLGIIFFEMLTQCKPYIASSAAKVIYKHIHAPIPKLPAKLRRYQPVLDLLLAKDPDDRIASAQELINHL